MIPRFELLNPYDFEKTKKNNQCTSKKPYLWLLVCLLCPLSMWFFVLGVIACVIAFMIPSMQHKMQLENFDKEFPEFLVYFRIATGSTDPYQAIAVAQNLVDNPLLKEKTGELAKSLMMGVVHEIDTGGTPAGFENFIGLLSNHQKLGLSLMETIEKLTSLTEERYFVRIKEGIRSRPITHTWIRLGTTAALLVYMYYPIIITLFRDLVF